MCIIESRAEGAAHFSETGGLNGDVRKKSSRNVPRRGGEFCNFKNHDYQLKWQLPLLALAFGLGFTACGAESITIESRSDSSQSVEFSPRSDRNPWMDYEDDRDDLLFLERNTSDCNPERYQNNSPNPSLTQLDVHFSDIFYDDPYGLLP